MGNRVRRAAAGLALGLASIGARALDVSPYWNFDLAQRQGEAARPYFARAWQLLSADTSLDRPDAARLARLERLSR